VCALFHVEFLVIRCRRAKKAGTLKLACLLHKNLLQLLEDGNGKVFVRFQIIQGIKHHRMAENGDQRCILFDFSIRNCLRLGTVGIHQESFKH
jgi:hypothetical protein